MSAQAQPDLWTLYRQMLRSRRFEELVSELWREGLVSGEMHLGTGEEAIVAGVVDQLRDGDALALDHRGTPPLVMRGVDLLALLLELLGQPEGLCHGMGGHMHLFSREHLAASSGIVGASGPAAVGFALAGRHLRPGAVSVAFFGEGAMNEGMLMEALNLAVAWHLPVLFVCKDNAWAITTQSPKVTAGDLTGRAQAFGMAAFEVDGNDVAAVWRTAHRWTNHARAGGGPAFMHARCSHFEGHFLGDPMLRMARQPSGDSLAQMSAMLQAMVRLKGAPFAERVGSVRSLLVTLQAARSDHDRTVADPIHLARGRLLPELPRLRELERAVEQEIEQVHRKALAAYQSSQRKPA